VLTDLPPKTASLEKVPMSRRQSELYFQLVSTYKDRAARVSLSSLLTVYTLLIR
jgi:hypothetical protein